METVWQGIVELSETQVFPRGSRLVLEPGTEVRFAQRDLDGDGWGDVSLQVDGDLVACGTPDNPIIFTSLGTPPTPGAWGEIRIDFGSFELCSVVIEGSTRGLHSHFSKGTVRDSVFRWNIDGTRLGESDVTLEHNLFYGHPGKAYNSRLCRNTVASNRFHHNRYGLFLFEADRGSTFTANQFADNEQPLRLGDFFQGSIHTTGNDWGGPRPSLNDEDTGQSLHTAPGRAANAGPRGWTFWMADWATRFDAFVDTAPLWTDEGIYVATWAGEVARIGFLDGSIRSSLHLPDVVDAAVAVAGEHIAVQSWDRRLYLVERSSLQIRDSFLEQPSPADDHRQSAPLLDRGVLYGATWAGTVRAFDLNGGELAPLWELNGKGPFRADLTLVGTVLLAPNGDGTLYALEALTGKPEWLFHAGPPLLSAATVDRERAYLADRSGKFWALSLHDGKPAWSIQLSAAVWYAPPLLVDGILYQGDDAGTLTAINSGDGTVLWTRNLGHAIRSRPAAVGTHVAVATLGGRLYLLDRYSGLERDCWQADGPSLASPAAEGDRVIFAARDGSVRVLHLENQ